MFISKFNNSKELYDNIKYNTFKNQFITSYKKDIERIKEHISNCNRKLNIKLYDIGYIDILRKMKDKKYLSDLDYELIDNGIKIVLPLNEFMLDIKDSISKSVDTLSIPFSLFNNYIDIFNNVKTLNINDDYILTEEDIVNIYNKTNIRNITINNNYLNSDTLSSLYSGNNISSIYEEQRQQIIYKDMVITTKNNEDKVNKNLVINTHIFDINLINKLYNMSDSKDITNIYINISNVVNLLIKFNNKKEIDILSIKSSDIDILYKIITFISNNYVINDICINVIDVDYTMIDYSKLKNITNKDKIKFNYGAGDIALYEDFIWLVDAIRWYRKIIEDYELSPLEKLTFAYDIVKSFEYKEDNNDRSNSRDLHKVIKSGNIVCVGYSNLIKEILKNIDNNINMKTTSCSCYNEQDNSSSGHKRNIVKIDDDKYNIHGIYFLDATWDSYNKDNVDDCGYTGLELYSFYLVPVYKYLSFFKNNSIPKIADKEIYNDKIKLEHEYQNIFHENMNYENILQYIYSKRPSLDVIKKVLIKVRFCEGFKNTLNEVEKSIIINNLFIDKINESGENIEFFYKK